MRIESLHFRDFKRFADLRVLDIPATARLVVLVGPNGSGKSSLFEALNYWISRIKGLNFDKEYHAKVGGQATEDWRQLMQRVVVNFHGAQGGDVRDDPVKGKKALYLRSAYRNEADFISNQLTRSDDVLQDSHRPPMMISAEARVGDNYQRIVADSLVALFDPLQKDVTAGAITDKLIGRAREAMSRVFPDLMLAGPGRPMEGGTFLFDKGTSKGYHYKNLSGGEKAAFDLLLDFVVKSTAFDDTVFCIDEPEMHMHTRLQGALLEELWHQLPPNCQLWIATHSIGMTRKAMDLHSLHPDEIAFLDFTDVDFDIPQTIRPVAVSRAFWKKIFGVALDDLADLIAPSEVVFCEGRKEVGSSQRNPTFDASIYRKIFSSSHPDTEFVPLGGTSEVEKDSLLIQSVLGKLFTSIRMWSIYDRDDRSKEEIAELAKRGVRVLPRRDLESFLWDDEILTKLCAQHGQPNKAQTLLTKKKELLSALTSLGRPADDIKSIAGPLYNFTKSSLTLVGCGNDAISFARDTLAPLLTPEANVFTELQLAVFGRS
jgi:predicted ATPase